MILDNLNKYSDAQAVTVTAVSSNVVDHGQGARDLGTGENLYLHVNVDTAMTSAGGTETVTVTMETDDNEAFGSATVAQTIGVFAAASAAGARLIARLQPLAINERFTRLRYTVANGPLTAGAFSAYLVHGVDAGAHKPDNITIS